MRTLLHSLTAATLLVFAGSSSAAVIGVFDGQSGSNSTAIATFLNGNGHTATNFGAGDINPGNLAGLDVVILLRTSGNADLVSFVSGGGKLITEWTSFDWAANAGLLGANPTGGLFVASPDNVTFTAAGLAMGLGNGLSNPYNDAGRTDFFRTATGITADILATRSSGDAAILGQATGSGYTVGNMYDWADWSEGNGADLANTQQMLLNMIAMSGVPEPATLALAALGLGFVASRRRRTAA